MNKISNEFLVVKDKNLKTLKQFIPIVNRVHGSNHQEFKDVVLEFDKLTAKIETNDFVLDDEFNKLKAITNNYTVPSGVCESYESVYVMLEELDKAYKCKGA